MSDQTVKARPHISSKQQNSKVSLTQFILNNISQVTKLFMPQNTNGSVKEDQLMKAGDGAAKILEELHHVKTEFTNKFLVNFSITILIT